MLQWGHRLSAMEMWTRWNSATWGNSRFNGATAFRRWRCAEQAGHRPQHLAASMGPPPFGDGDVLNKRATDRSISRLQWGHRLSAMEILGYRHRCPGLLHASMGPPPFGDGDGIGWRDSPSGLKCFNGATAFRRWRSLMRHDDLRVLWLLQWGHRLSAMEMAPDRGRCRSSSSRFNGATAFRRWRYRMIITSDCVQRKLQWGHRLSAMEIPEGNGITYSLVKLQWGHRLSAMEIQLPGHRPGPG